MGNGLLNCKKKMNRNAKLFVFGIASLPAHPPPISSSFPFSLYHFLFFLPHQHPNPTLNPKTLSQHSIKTSCPPPKTLNPKP